MNVKALFGAKFLQFTKPYLFGSKFAIYLITTIKLI